MTTHPPLPDDGVLYEHVESQFNLAAMASISKLAKCRICGAAVSGDDNALELHKQFHLFLLERTMGDN